MIEPMLSMVCGTDDGAGADVLRVLAKRTYDISSNGQCRVASMHAPLQFDELTHDRKGQGGIAPPRAESDVMCNTKPGTDVVVQGKAHVIGSPRASIDVTVTLVTPQMTADQIRRSARRIRVFGDRKVQSLGNGKLRFTEPEPFTSMDLSYDRAYGGRDIWAEKTHPDLLASFMKKYSSSGQEPSSKYEYARNSAGRGYLVYPDEQAFAEIALPNLEDPNDLLTPERLCIGDVDNWHLAPIPAGFDWISVGWFPRSAFLGGTPSVNGKATAIPEVRSGTVPLSLVELPGEQFMPTLTVEHIAQFAHGASPWLCFPTLTGHESLLLQGFHPHTPHMTIGLPRERPRVYLQPPSGISKEVAPALRTVVIDTEANRLTTLWAASLALDRPLTEAQQEKVRHAVQWSS